MHLDGCTCSQAASAAESSCLLQRMPHYSAVVDAAAMKRRTEKGLLPVSDIAEVYPITVDGTVARVHANRNALSHNGATTDPRGRNSTLVDDLHGALKNSRTSIRSISKRRIGEENAGDHAGSALNDIVIVAPEDTLTEDNLAPKDIKLERSETRIHHVFDILGRWASTLVALILLAMVALVMSVFYLFNYPEEDGQDATWMLLSSTLALFSAVLIFTVLKDAMDMLQVWDSRPGSQVHVLLVINSMRLVAVLIISRWATKAWASIGMNLAGFAAVEAFETLQRYAFAHSWQHGMVTVIGTATGLLLLSFTFTRVVRAIVHQPSQNLIEACKHSGVDSAGQTLGLIVALTVYHAIDGAVPWVKHGGISESSTTASEFHRLSMASFIGILLIASNFWMNHARQGTRVEHLARSTQGILSMAIGWCLLSWGQWLSWFSGGKDSELVSVPAIIAVLISGLILASLFLYDCMSLQSFPAPIGIRALTVSAAVFLGLAWETVFVLAVQGISGWMIGASVRVTMTDAGLTTLLWGWCCQLGYCLSYLHDSYM